MKQINSTLLMNTSFEYKNQSRQCFLSMRDKILDKQPNSATEFIALLNEFRQGITRDSSTSLFRFYTELEKVWKSDSLEELSQIIWADEARASAKNKYYIKNKNANQPL